jgi:hypothetical protein
VAPRRPRRARPESACEKLKKWSRDCGTASQCSLPLPPSLPFLFFFPPVPQPTRSNTHRLRQLSPRALLFFTVPPLPVGRFSIASLPCAASLSRPQRPASSPAPIAPSSPPCLSRG